MVGKVDEQHVRVKNLKYLTARLIKTIRKLQSHQVVFLMSLRTLKGLRVQFSFVNNPNSL